MWELKWTEKRLTLFVSLVSICPETLTGVDERAKEDADESGHQYPSHRAPPHRVDVDGILD